MASWSSAWRRCHSATLPSRSAMVARNALVSSVSFARVFSSSASRPWTRAWRVSRSLEISRWTRVLRSDSARASAAADSLASRAPPSSSMAASIPSIWPRSSSVWVRSAVSSAWREVMRCTWAS